MTMLSMMAAATGGAPPPRTGTFGLDVDGDGRATNVTNQPTTPGAVSIERAVHSGDPAFRDVRLAYDLQAQAAGLDPATIRPGSAEDRQVVTDLGQTLGRIAAQPRGAGGGIASAVSDLRAEAQATVSLRTASAATGLSPSALASAAHAPGASFAADALPVTRSLMEGSGALRRTPATAVAGAVGTVGGVAIAVGAGKLSEANTATLERDRADARATLDTDRDGKLECREIGHWAPENENGRSKNVVAYQAYVSGMPGMHFPVVTPSTGKVVSFDGCVDDTAGAKLLEAKADHENVLKDFATKWDGGGARPKVLKQGETQSRTAAEFGTKLEWHVQTEHDANVIKDLFVSRFSNIEVIHDPIRPMK